MDDLIKQITEKTGISIDQAKGAISTVMGFVGDKLPAPIASQVQKLLGSDDGGGDGDGGDGDGGDDDGGGSLLDKAKGMFGG